MKQLPLSAKRGQSHFNITIAFFCSPLMLMSLANTAMADTMLEEVIVEAQKREQNLQDVPVAVTAFTNEDLAKAVVKDIFDLQSGAPGLIVAQNQTATTAHFNIRGIGTSSQNFGLESSVGLYIDDSYRSRQSAMINNMVDLQSAEVLRGPQGTLFGKNTLAGAVLFHTVAPSFDDHNGFIEITTGNYNLTNLSAASSFIAMDNQLAFRATAFTSTRDGYIDQLNLGVTTEDKINDRDRWGTRLQALYTPSDTFTLKAILDYSEINEVCCAAVTTLSNFGLTSKAPGTLDQPGTDTLLNVLGGTITQGDNYDDYQTATNAPPYSSNKDRGLQVNMRWDLDDYTVKSISALRRFDSYDFVDADFSDIALLSADNDAKLDSFSQELRLELSSGNVNYLFGAYYYQQTIDLVNTLMTGSQFDDYFDLVLPASITSRSPSSPGLLYGIDALSAFTSGAIPPSASGYPADFTFFNQSKQDHENIALFGQADIQLNSQWTVSTGLRLTHEKKQLDAHFTEASANGQGLGPQFFSATELGAGALAAGISLAEIQADGQLTPDRLSTLQPFQTAGWGLGLLGPLTSARAPLSTSFSENIVTGSIKLSYTPDANQLYYLSLATGFKSGGTNTDRIAEVFDPVFSSEKSRAFELGMKYEAPEKSWRSNLALHLTDIDNYQANSWTGVAFNLQNAGKLQSYGMEWELEWAPLDNTRVDIGYAYTHAQFKQFEQGTCWVATPFHTGESDPGDSGLGYCSRSGERIDFTPEHSANITLEQSLHLTANIDARISGDYNVKSDMIMDGDNDPLKRQPSYTLVNLRMALEFKQQDVSIILWGRNIFDKRVKRTIFSVPIQDGHLMSYPGEPVTYGITVNKHFD